MKGFLRAVFEYCIALVALPVLAAFAIFAMRRKKSDLVWGAEALINYKYWSRALDSPQRRAYSLIEQMSGKLFSRTDFDMAYEDLAPNWISDAWLWQFFQHYAAAVYIFRHAAVYHCSFSGGPLRATRLRWLEAQLYALANVKTIVVPFGGDFWRYSKILDSAMRHAMLINYATLGRVENEVNRRVEYWTYAADIVVGTIATDGLGRWDTLTTNPITIDVEAWPRRESWSDARGDDAPVTIVHAPNHRGIKGTEFFLAALDALREKGLAFKLVLLEGVPNTEVLQQLRSADICLEQCATGMGYGLFAIESMACGAPVVGCLEDPYRLNLHRQYSYLNECPVVSSDVDHLEATLERLIRDPQLRMTLGAAGRAFVEKYHGDNAARYFFGLIHRKLLEQPDLDIMSPFHPVLSPFVIGKPRIPLPMKRNRLY